MSIQSIQARETQIKLSSWAMLIKHDSRFCCCIACFPPQTSEVLFSNDLRMFVTWVPFFFSAWERTKKCSNLHEATGREIIRLCPGTLWSAPVDDIPWKLKLVWDGARQIRIHELVWRWRSLKSIFNTKSSAVTGKSCSSSQYSGCGMVAGFYDHNLK